MSFLQQLNKAIKYSHPINADVSFDFKNHRITCGDDRYLRVVPYAFGRAIDGLKTISANDINEYRVESDLYSLQTSKIPEIEMNYEFCSGFYHDEIIKFIKSAGSIGDNLFLCFFGNEVKLMSNFGELKIGSTDINGKMCSLGASRFYKYMVNEKPDGFCLTNHNSLLFKDSNGYFSIRKT